MRNQDMLSKSAIRALLRGSLLFMLVAVALPQTLDSGQSVPDEVGDEEYIVASTAIEHFGRTFLEGARVFVIFGKTRADQRLPAAVDRIRHPEPPEKPKTEEHPALRRPRDPEKRKHAKDLKEEWLQKTLQDERAFAEEISDQTILDWTRKNQESSSLKNNFQVSTPVVVLSDADIKRLKTTGRGSSKDFWSAFGEKFPEAGFIVTISRVGFNPEHTQAIIEVGYTTGPIGGEGDYVLLEKENGVWKVHSLLGAWLS